MSSGSTDEEKQARAHDEALFGEWFNATVMPTVPHRADPKAIENVRAVARAAFFAGRAASLAEANELRAQLTDLMQRAVNGAYCRREHIN